MSLNSELRDKLAGEIRQFSTALNLSDDQKRQLQDSLSSPYERGQEYRQEHPGATREDLVREMSANRNSIRQRLVRFLTPEQLTKWDSEVAKAKDFLSQMAAGAS